MLYWWSQLLCYIAHEPCEPFYEIGIAQMVALCIELKTPKETENGILVVLLKNLSLRACIGNASYASQRKRKGD